MVEGLEVQHSQSREIFSLSIGFKDEEKLFFNAVKTFLYLTQHSRKQESVNGFYWIDSAVNGVSGGGDGHISNIPMCDTGVYMSWEGDSKRLWVIGVFN